MSVGELYWTPSYGYVRVMYLNATPTTFMAYQIYDPLELPVAVTTVTTYPAWETFAGPRSHDEKYRGRRR